MAAILNRRYRAQRRNRMDVEGNDSAAAQISVDPSTPICGRHAEIAETEVEMPVERTEGFHLFSDIPPARIAKRFKEF